MCGQTTSGVADALRQVAQDPFVYVLVPQLCDDDCAYVLGIVLVTEVCRTGRPR